MTIIEILKDDFPEIRIKGRCTHFDYYIDKIKDESIYLHLWYYTINSIPYITALVSYYKGCYGDVAIYKIDLNSPILLDTAREGGVSYKDSKIIRESMKYLYNKTKIKLDKMR